MVMMMLWCHKAVQPVSGLSEVGGACMYLYTVCYYTSVNTYPTTFIYREEYKSPVLCSGTREHAPKSACQPKHGPCTNICCIRLVLYHCILSSHLIRLQPILLLSMNSLSRSRRLRCRLHHHPWTRPRLPRLRSRPRLRCRLRRPHLHRYRPSPQPANHNHPQSSTKCAFQA